jgi:hypothetical protein
VRTDIYLVSPSFFATMGIPFLAGENFRTGQAGGVRPAIVNDAFARAAFRDGSPVGRRVLGDGKALDVVGVVATAKSRSIGEAARPCIYLPMMSEYSAREIPRGITLVVQTKGAPMTAAGAVRDAITSVDRSLAVFDVRTMDAHLRDALIVPRLMSSLSAIAATIGLAVATIGLYGVISFAIERRRRELGIRLAIGARPGAILAMVLKQGAALAAIGTAMGVLLSWGVMRFAASLLYVISPADPLTFVAVPVVLMAVSLLACVPPARSAARVDPVDVLRSE